MTLNFFQPAKREYLDKSRYYILEFDSNTFQVVDSVENREVCVCSNYDAWEDAEERAKKIVLLLNQSVEKTTK